ncbi:MAG: hypothetical protein E6G31_06525 [Actinobacteria bacterium]|nr:MAG: hypothetical protein E6G31_06525 [Actinomycetota bacterium]
MGIAPSTRKCFASVLAPAAPLPRSLSRSPLSPRHHDQGDQEKHDSRGADDVGHHGNRPGNVAGVGPDEADDRAHDKHDDHRSQPVQNPSPSDDAEPTLMTEFRQLKHQALASSRDSRTAVAAILAGVLIFAGQTGELVFGDGSDALLALEVTLWSLGVVALVVAIWRLGRLVSTRTGRIGWRVALAGVALLGLFAVQVVITVAVTGDVPGNFILFGLGFLLLFVGHLLIATGLRDALGRAWLLPLVAAAGIIVAITLNVDPIHDIGLFVFEGSWVALGVALLLGAERGPRPEPRVSVPV